jgi:hypothetical protein
MTMAAEARNSQKVVPKPAGAVRGRGSVAVLLAVMTMVLSVPSVAGEEGESADTIVHVEDKKPSVDRALEWIIEHQCADGGWSFDLKACPKCHGKCIHPGHVDTRADRVAATALALLPFLGRGYCHTQWPFKTQLENGITFLAKKAIAGDGKIFGEEGGIDKGHAAQGGRLACTALAATILSVNPRLRISTDETNDDEFAE